MLKKQRVSFYVAAAAALCALLALVLFIVSNGTVGYPILNSSLARSGKLRAREEYRTSLMRKSSYLPEGAALSTLRGFFPAASSLGSKRNRFQYPASTADFMMLMLLPMPARAPWLMQGA